MAACFILLFLFLGQVAYPISDPFPLDSGLIMEYSLRYEMVYNTTQRTDLIFGKYSRKVMSVSNDTVTIMNYLHFDSSYSNSGGVSDTNRQTYDDSLYSNYIINPDKKICIRNDMLSDLPEMDASLSIGDSTPTFDAKSLVIKYVEEKSESLFGRWVPTIKGYTYQSGNIDSSDYYEFAENIGLVRARTSLRIFLTPRDLPYNWHAWIEMTSTNIFDLKSEKRVLNADKLSLQCFPNPFNDEVGIRFDGLKPGRYELTIGSLDGRIVLRGHLQPMDNFTWKPKETPPGIYFITVHGPGMHHSKKAVLFR